MKTTDNNNNQPSHEGTGTKLAVILFAGLLMLMTMGKLHSQNANTTVKPKAVVLNFDAKNVGYDPVAMGNLVRLELEKLDTFDVMDRYDVNYLVAKNNLQVNNCYGKICLVELGKQLGADKMITGSVEVYGDAIIYTMRLIDVKSESIERTHVVE
ncbi:MAG: hypothetical protein RL007_1761, partial [Bacteroidota bacterium]